MRQRQRAVAAAGRPQVGAAYNLERAQSPVDFPALVLNGRAEYLAYPFRALGADWMGTRDVAAGGERSGLFVKLAGEQVLLLLVCAPAM